MTHTLSRIFITYLLFFFSTTASAKDEIELEIKIINHVFHPSEIEAPEGTNIKLIVHNEDDTVEEFESSDLKREKIVPPGGKVNIILAPLAPGEYKFVGEFHESTAKGVLTIKAK